MSAREGPTHCQPPRGAHARGRARRQRLYCKGRGARLSDIGAAILLEGALLRAGVGRVRRAELRARRRPRQHIAPPLPGAGLTATRCCRSLRAPTQGVTETSPDFIGTALVAQNGAASSRSASAATNGAPVRQRIMGHDQPGAI